MFNPFRRPHLPPLIPPAPPRTRYQSERAMATEALSALPSSIWADILITSAIGQSSTEVRRVAQNLDRYADVLERNGK